MPSSAMRLSTWHRERRRWPSRLTWKVAAEVSSHQPWTSTPSWQYGRRSHMGRCSRSMTGLSRLMFTQSSFPQGCGVSCRTTRRGRGACCSTTADLASTGRSRSSRGARWRPGSRAPRPASSASSASARGRAAGARTCSLTSASWRCLACGETTSGDCSRSRAAPATGSSPPRAGRPTRAGQATLPSIRFGRRRASVSACQMRSTTLGRREPFLNLHLGSYCRV
mmetsp:Transcript_10337/g.30348  ORF Transcript_10337/g.30348 Transcript_10337/m.30348 type:complete len:224 (+) Transcript_10337:571-1242(+)